MAWATARGTTCRGRSSYLRSDRWGTDGHQAHQPLPTSNSQVLHVLSQLRLPSVGSSAVCFLISSRKWPGSRRPRKPIEPLRPSRAACPKASGSSALRAREIIYNKDLAAEPERLPEVRSPLPDERDRPSQDAVRRRVDGVRRGPAVDRSAEVHRHEALPRRGSKRASPPPG